MKGLRSVAAVLLLCGVAQAQSASQREQAIDMATITAAHALCGFEITEGQEDAIAKRRQAIVDDGAVTAAEAASIEAELLAVMKRQVPEGLCRPDGAAAKLYRQKLAEFGSE